jgi:ribosomal protein S18 acetylase RimI-like enzyme
MSTSQINPNQLLPFGDDGPNGPDGLGRIIQVPPHRRDEAVARLVWQPGGDRDHGRRFLDYAQSHRIPLERLWARLDPLDRMQAVVLAVPSPGRTAILFASHPLAKDQVRSLGGVIDATCRSVAKEGVDVAQVLLDPSEQLEQNAFSSGGFMTLATLSYLERPVRPPRGYTAPPPQWPPGIKVVRYQPSLDSELLSVLDASYEETMDCPGLRGLRRTIDILDGHRHSGAFDPSLWTLLMINGDYVGALLLNPAMDASAIELVYLGLAKSARGLGLGRQLLRYGLRLIEARKEKNITLAVDEANLPAVSLYRAEGFRQAMRRVAMIRPF